MISLKGVSEFPTIVTVLGTPIYILNYNYQLREAGLNFDMVLDNMSLHRQIDKGRGREFFL